MPERLGELNLSLRAELDRPLRIGIGIHCGPVIVGEMGYGSATRDHRDRRRRQHRQPAGKPDQDL